MTYQYWSRGENGELLIDADELRQVLTQFAGKVRLVAKHYGCDKNTVYRWMRAVNITKDDLADMRQSRDEVLVETAEQELLKAVRNGEGWAIRYVLNNKGDEAGYGDRIQERMEIIKKHPEVIELIRLIEQSGNRPGAVFTRMIERIKADMTVTGIKPAGITQQQETNDE